MSKSYGTIIIEFESDIPQEILEVEFNDYLIKRGIVKLTNHKMDEAVLDAHSVEVQFES
jgi:hypothetical protein